MPAVQAEFAVDRGAASLPYTAAMIGLMTGTVVIGRLSDRFGLMRPAMGAVVLLAGGYVATAFAPGITSYAVLYGALVGVGGSAMFAPLIADVSLWFSGRRGLAIGQIGREHVCTPVTNAQIVCRLLVEKNTKNEDPRHDR